MSPRRTSYSGQSRQGIALRLRERRVREENLIIEAADALARRRIAEDAVSDATDALVGALAQLEQLGFALADIAELLEVEPSELTAGGSSRRSGGRSVRTGSDSTDGAPGPG
jgi:hypothetical protein